MGIKVDLLNRCFAVNHHDFSLIVFASIKLPHCVIFCVLDTEPVSTTYPTEINAKQIPNIDRKSFRNDKAV